MTVAILLAIFAFTVAALVWLALDQPDLAVFFTVSVAIIAALMPLPALAGPLDPFVAVVMPHLLELLGLALTGIIGWAASKARQKWGIEIEARYREALHSALMTGALLALKHELTGQAAIDLILRYIRQSVPDAIIGLDARPDVLADLAKAKMELVATEKVKDVTGVAVDKLAEALRRAGVA